MLHLLDDLGDVPRECQLAQRGPLASARSGDNLL
jgi:hypothetical protein